jgi:hypothetical protein
MKNQEIPFYWRVNELTLVNFHRYTSHVVDAFIEIREYGEEDKLTPAYAWFTALRERVMKAHILFEDGIERTRYWDNKVVIECLTPNGNTIYVGYYDFTMQIGLSVKSDSWIRICPISEHSLSEADYWDGDETDKISY